MAEKTSLGLKIIGSLKLVSAVLLVAAGISILHFVDHGISDELEDIIGQLRLAPERHLLQLIIAKLTGVEPMKLKEIAIGTFCYAVLYVIEGIGLLKARRWAEYLTIIITGSFLPLECYEIAMKFSAVRIAVFLVNLAIMVYLIRQLKKDRKHS